MVMTRRFLSLLSALFLLPAAIFAADAPVPLRVLSFNVRYENSNDKGDNAWTARKVEAAKVIRGDNPDLIGFQEALRSMLDDLAATVSGYQEIGVGREDGKTKGEYSAIWVKKDRFEVQDSGTFWLSETPEIPDSKSWGNRVTRVCTWAKLLDKPSGRMLHFYNLHLDHESQEARDKGTAQVLKHMETRTPAGPFVLTGDFNSGENSSVLKAILDSNLKPIDSWRAVHPENPGSGSGTFHSFTGATDKGRIDYIFVPPGTKITDAEIIHQHNGNVYPSDHFPIRATVEFSAEKP